MVAGPVAPKILVYDGACALCTRASRLVERRWLVGSAERRALEDFDADGQIALLAAGVHNEMAVLEPGTGAIRTGYDGILWLLGGGALRAFVPVIARGPLAWLGRHDYRTVAFNRRILSPPIHDMACACDPDLHRGYRWSFIVACLVWMAVLTGALAWLALGRSAWIGGALPLAWLLLAPAAVALPSPRGLDLLGHLAFVGAAMVLPGLAAMVLGAAWLLGVASGWWTGTAPLIWLTGAAWLAALP
ncbi:MAG: hypothetical protein O2894_14220, partial [Planctomycetota bacterium]|nr:hypothetical protein [Planctomycetota bacterium]